MEWTEYPSYKDGVVTLKGTLLNSAVFAHPTAAPRRGGGIYPNFRIRLASDHKYLGSVLPQKSDLPLSGWPLYPFDVLADSYHLDGQSFAISFTFPAGLEHHPSDYVVTVYGFQDASRTPTLGLHSDSGQYTDLLGYARLRMLSPVIEPVASEEIILNTVNPTPRAMVSADWYWPGASAFGEIEVTVNIHNDIEYRGRNGLYLIACASFAIGDNLSYFGLQTDVKDPERGGSQGKGAIFSRWYGENKPWPARQQDVRAAEGSWIEAGDYEGNFVSVRGAYDWSEGEYVMRVSAEEADENGSWFGLYVNDTWIGSLRFAEGARIHPGCATPIEVYGAPVRPSDIPYWKVSVSPPTGDGVEAKLWRTRYPENVGSLRNVLATVDGDVVTLEVGLDYLAHD